LSFPLLLLLLLFFSVFSKSEGGTSLAKECEARKEDARRTKKKILANLTTKKLKKKRERERIFFFWSFNFEGQNDEFGVAKWLGLLMHHSFIFI
jgi:hypothetical protein